MSIYTTVPLIKQEKSMSCWHASARMLWAFKYRQSFNPLGHIYAANTGISAPKFVTLARTVGLESVHQINMSYTWSILADLLTRHGPLWAAGYWYRSPHIVVITGVEPSGRIHVNDPAGVRRIWDMRFFNEKIASDVHNPLMYLPNSRANAQGYGTYFQ
ncbi:MAG: papain-like cysteine protease family protein [Bacteroidia bacterium]